jgi:hypothetical protein
MHFWSVQHLQVVAAAVGAFVAAGAAVATAAPAAAVAATAAHAETAAATAAPAATKAPTAAATTCKCWTDQKCIVYMKDDTKESCWVKQKDNCSDSYEGTKDPTHKGYYLSYKACENRRVLAAQI